MSEQLITRHCTNCGLDKPRSEFWKEARTVDGLRSICKSCQNAYFREHRYPKLKLSDKRKQQRREYQKRYAGAHPEVIRAHSLIRAKKDSLQKSACEQCGSIDRLHMHHPDYSKPLEVVTLCIQCHTTVHMEQRHEGH